MTATGTAMPTGVRGRWSLRWPGRRARRDRRLVSLRFALQTRAAAALLQTPDYDAQRINVPLVTGLLTIRFFQELEDELHLVERIA